MQTSRSLRFLALFFVFLLACSPAVAAEDVTVGVASNSASNWPLYVALSLGYFEKAGLSVTVVNAGSVAAVAQQLVGGSIDIGDVSSTQTIEAVQGGAPIHAVFNRVSKASYQLIAQKNIKSVAQLKKQLVIVGGANDITRIFTDAMLAADGLKPDEFDYTFAGGTGDRYAALKSGSVAAAILLPPFSFRAIAEGYPSLGSAVTKFPNFPFVGFDANDRWATSHADVLAKFLGANLQAVAWLYDKKNRAQAAEILSKATGTSAEDSAKSYDQQVVQDHVYSRTGRYTSQDEDIVIAALAKLGVLKAPLPPAGKFYDNRYVEAAARAATHK